MRISRQFKQLEWKPTITNEQGIIIAICDSSCCATVIAQGIISEVNIREGEKYLREDNMLNF